MAARSGGFAGKVLVDLSTGKISTQDTVERYEAVLGGAGSATGCCGTRSRPGPAPSIRPTSSCSPPGCWPARARPATGAVP